MVKAKFYYILPTIVLGGSLSVDGLYIDGGS